MGERLTRATEKGISGHKYPTRDRSKQEISSSPEWSFGTPRILWEAHPMLGMLLGSDLHRVLSKRYRAAFGLSME
jgi:hypothetical protein